MPAPDEAPATTSPRWHESWRLRPSPRRYQRIMKRLLPILAVPALLLTGCSAGNDTTASSAPSATTTTTASTPATSPAASASSGDNSGTVSAGQGGGTARCHTGDLSLKVGTGGAAAGTYHTNLVFTDKSGHKCTLEGYPGVSWVTGDNGTQVNDPFQRNSGPKKTITLSPGGQAHAVLITHAALNYPADKCKPTDVRGYRIYPPDETAAIFVSAPGQECSIKGVNLGQVLPIASGAGSADD